MRQTKLDLVSTSMEKKGMIITNIQAGLSECVWMCGCLAYPTLQTYHLGFAALVKGGTAVRTRPDPRRRSHVRPLWIGMSSAPG